MIKIERWPTVPSSLENEIGQGGQLERAINNFIAYFESLERGSEAIQGPVDPEGKDTEGIGIPDVYYEENKKRKTFKFKNYNLDDVKQKLNDMFHKKCAYCESTYEHVHPMDVEHFRPKGSVQQYRGDSRRLSGYYWLAWDWDNLFPSCIHCNRVSYQDTFNNGKVLRGKGNLFPLEEDSKRATRHTYLINDEFPLLLNPCKDNPEDHIEFTDEGVIRPTINEGKESMKGDISIKVYGLDRLSLSMEREKVTVNIKAQIKSVKSAWKNLLRYPDDPEFEEQLSFEMGELKSFMLPEKTYSQMAKQIIGRFLTESGLESDTTEGTLVR
ncbi:TIGR02646 family protein [Bacillus sp. OV166]|uniref:hypothetical protein n=1 Tax=Bacillus sp. OV166 TaxID=1882763 RepID=UPI000A2ADDE6|nr:hypothetical protein [Bacillus sp. OV166]SMQ61013.1 TIGR02646 family protein [Bacillus sp. OV166]